MFDFYAFVLIEYLKRLYCMFQGFLFIINSRSQSTNELGCSNFTPVYNGGPTEIGICLEFIQWPVIKKPRTRPVYQIHCAERQPWMVTHKRGRELSARTSRGQQVCDWAAEQRVYTVHWWCNTALTRYCSQSADCVDSEWPSEGLQFAEETI